MSVVFVSSRVSFVGSDARNGAEQGVAAMARRWAQVVGPDRRVLQERVVPTVHRSEETLRERLPIGPAEVFAEKLTAFARAGVQRVFIWPVADEARQLERFWNEVRPLVGR